MLIALVNILAFIAGLATLVSGKLKISGDHEVTGLKARLSGLVLMAAGFLDLFGFTNFAISFVAFACGVTSIGTVVTLMAWSTLMVYALATASILAIVRFVPAEAAKA